MKLLLMTRKYGLLQDHIRDVAKRIHLGCFYKRLQKNKNYQLYKWLNRFGKSFEEHWLFGVFDS